MHNIRETFPCSRLWLTAGGLRVFVKIVGVVGDNIIVRLIRFRIRIRCRWIVLARALRIELRDSFTGPLVRANDQLAQELVA